MKAMKRIFKSEQPVCIASGDSIENLFEHSRTFRDDARILL